MGWDVHRGWKANMRITVLQPVDANAQKISQHHKKGYITPWVARMFFSGQCQKIGNAMLKRFPCQPISWWSTSSQKLHACQDSNALTCLDHPNTTIAKNRSKNKPSPITNHVKAIFRHPKRFTQDLLFVCVASWFKIRNPKTLLWYAKDMWNYGVRIINTKSR